MQAIFIATLTFWLLLSVGQADSLLHDRSSRVSRQNSRPLYIRIPEMNSGTTFYEDEDESDATIEQEVLSRSAAKVITNEGELYPRGSSGKDSPGRGSIIPAARSGKISADPKNAAINRQGVPKDKNIQDDKHTVHDLVLSRQRGITSKLQSKALDSVEAASNWNARASKHSAEAQVESIIGGFNREMGDAEKKLRSDHKKAQSEGWNHIEQAARHHRDYHTSLTTQSKMFDAGFRTNEDLEKVKGRSRPAVHTREKPKSASWYKYLKSTDSYSRMWSKSER